MLDCSLITLPRAGTKYEATNYMTYYKWIGFNDIFMYQHAYFITKL